jgi:DNA invertase Pin-like site-specific DNA recombinase
MFATLAKQEQARISERTIAELKVARAKGKRLGRPPLSKETIRTVLSLNEDAGIGARKIARSTGFSLGTSKRNFDQIAATGAAELSKVLQAVNKEVVGTHDPLTRSLFDGDILHRLLRRVSLANPTSAPLRF